MEMIAKIVFWRTSTYWFCA